jgi:Metal-sensitive transcriptional repressor
MYATQRDTSHGYIEANDRELLQNRLKRIEGQVRGVQRMVDEEAYCIDVLTQIATVMEPCTMGRPVVQAVRRRVGMVSFFLMLRRFVGAVVGA